MLLLKTRFDRYHQIDRNTKTSATDTANIF